MTTIARGPVRSLLAPALAAACLSLLVGCATTSGEGGKAAQGSGASQARENGEAGSQKAPDESTKAEPQTGQFLKAEGTSVGGEDWVAEIHRKGRKLWLVSPFDAATTYAMVRASTFLQGLRLAEEDFDHQTFTTTLAYHSWHPESEGGFALTMKVLTKGFGKDARYRFRVSVERLDDDTGSRVDVRQFREVMEEDPSQDVGDWVKADKPDPEITRGYLKGVQKALGD